MFLYIYIYIYHIGKNNIHFKKCGKPETVSRHSPAPVRFVPAKLV